MQTLFNLNSHKSPIRYFGAKTKARRILASYLPRGVTEVVSPFLGGGAFELDLTGRGIRVHASDLFPPLVNLWKILLTHPHELCDAVRGLMEYVRHENWRTTVVEFARQSNECEILNAAQYLIVYNISFNNIGGARRITCSHFHVNDEGVPVKKGTDGRRDYLINYENIKGFKNDLLSVECLEFQDALANHPNLFTYCDPPYPEATPAYGDGPEYHEEFDHEGLAEILHSRDNWLLSYNNCDTVKSLYPPSEFHYDYPKWSLASKKARRSEESNEVLIMPKK